MKLLIVFKFIILCLLLIFFKTGCNSSAFTSGKLYIYEENYQRAILNFNKVVEFEPEDFETLVLLGESYFNLGETIRETRIKLTESGDDKNKIAELKKSESQY